MFLNNNKLVRQLISKVATCWVCRKFHFEASITKLHGSNFKIAIYTGYAARCSGLYTQRYQCLLMCTFYQNSASKLKIQKVGWFLSELNWFSQKQTLHINFRICSTTTDQFLMKIILSFANRISMHFCIPPPPLHHAISATVGGMEEKLEDNDHTN